MESQTTHTTIQASEMSQDQITDRDARLNDEYSSNQRQLSDEMRSEGSHIRSEFDPGQGDKKKEEDLRRATGIHPSIRATSTDDDKLTLPAPSLDDPFEDTPGEIENPRRDFDDEDFTEDAFEES